MKTLFPFSFALLLSFSLLAGEKQLLNLDKSGLAIQGYDPVTFAD
jgi:hypothetical protein